MVSRTCEEMLRDVCADYPQAIPTLRAAYDRQRIDDPWRQFELAVQVIARCTEVQATLDRRQAEARPLSRDEIRERYAWKPGEREAIERDIAERQRRIDAHWRRVDDYIVTKDHAAPARRGHRSESRPAAPAIERVMDAVGHVADAVERVVAIGQEGHTTVTRDLAGLRDQVKTLEAELAELRDRLDRATPSKSAPLRLLPFDQASMIA
jgi:hypothetical protein